MQIPFSENATARAIVLGTVVSISDMIGAANFHVKCLRKIKNDESWIRTLLNEAENERIHLMTFIHIAQPNWFERFIIFVGYLEEAVISYQHYLDEIDAGRIENVPAPQIATDYWSSPETARLRDVVIVVKADEEEHRDVNHDLADRIDRKEKIIS